MHNTFKVNNKQGYHLMPLWFSSLSTAWYKRSIFRTEALEQDNNRMPHDQSFRLLMTNGQSTSEYMYVFAQTHFILGYINELGIHVLSLTEYLHKLAVVCEQENIFRTV